jgi:hypothetical protein
VVSAVAVVVSVAGAAPSAARATAASAYGKLPIRFEANAGQSDPAVDFLRRDGSSTLFLSGGDAVLRLAGGGQDGEAPAVVRMRLAGTARRPRAEGVGRQRATSNYLLGGDRARWHTGIANYAAVRYPCIYPGVDLVYHQSEHSDGSARQQLEYDFIVAPHADPSRIRLGFDGVPALRSVALDAAGELVVRTLHGDIVQHPPEVYQVSPLDGRRETVAARYFLRPTAAGSEVGFMLGGYDRSRPLVIDPVLIYSTFLGGTATDSAKRVAVDGAGNAYITGMTYSATFPGVTAGSLQPAISNTSSNAFVIKLDPTGTTILYSTYLGGSGGASSGWGIAVDGAGNAYVAGNTTDASFPGVTASSIQPALGGQQDGFVTKLNAAGDAIVYSTYLGGNGDEGCCAVAVDAAGSAYVAGITTGPTFPGITAASIQSVAGGSFDGFLTKINAAGTAIVYSTFLGGSNADAAEGVAVDAAGNAYVAGLTFSTTFPGVTAASLQPASGGGYDGFVVKVDAAGTALVYATFLGSSGDDEALAIAVDAAGNAYVTGETDSADFPGVSAASLQPTIGGDYDGFVVKLNPAGTALVYSTFLGAEGSDTFAAIAVDSSGNAYLAGSTTSVSFPGATAGSIQPANSGSWDAILAVVNPPGTALRYSTLFGGAATDLAASLALDSWGNAYVVGFTASPALPGTGASSIQAANAGGSDGFAVKIATRVGRAFYTLSPCRVFDTRDAMPMAANETRAFQVAGTCGIPAGAVAVSTNLTAVAPRAAGFLAVFAGDAIQAPTTSSLNFAAGQVRANNATIGLGADGTIKILAALAQGTTHVLLDVNGYYR